MRRDLARDAPRICNSCVIKEKKRTNQGDIPVSEMQIIIKCSQEEHAKIEELCVNKGINYSDYFMGLHQLNIQESFQVPEVKGKVHVEVCYGDKSQESQEEEKCEIEEEKEENKSAKRGKKGKK